MVGGSLSWGPYPVATKLDERVTLFVDLTEEGELEPYVPRLGEDVRHVRMPIRDFGLPSDSQMVRTLDAIDDGLAAGKTVYVHCRAGVGRTRTVIGCHRKRHGLDPGSPPETAEQRELVRRWPRGR